MDEKAILIKYPHLSDEASWQKTSLWRIIMFLQPTKALSLYNKSKQHISHMLESKVNYALLPPLQESQFHAFDDRLESQIDNLWSRVVNMKNQSLIKLLWMNNRNPLIYYLCIIQTCVMTKMVVSYLLGRTLLLISQFMGQNVDNVTFRDIVAYSTSLSCLLVLQVMTEQHFFQNIYQVSIKIRFQIVGVLLRKLNSTTLSRMKEVSSGQYFNLISMDLGEIDSGLTWFMALSGSLIVAVLGMLLLFHYFGVSALIGIIVLITINLIQRYIIDKSASIKLSKSKAQDERTKLTSDFLHNIRTLKMFASQDTYRDLILQRRSEQDRLSRWLLLIDSISYCLTGNISVFIALLTTIISYIFLFDGQLSVDKIFGSLWVLQLIKIWCLTYFYRGIKFWVNMSILSSRLMDILQVGGLDSSAKVVQSVRKSRINGEEQDSELSEQTLENPKIIFKNYSGMWTKADLEKQNFNLKDINIRWDNQQDGQVICIVGKIGSYKSTLLQAILHEVPYQQGRLSVQGSLAYVEQTPYIFAGTIRENILFGKNYDEDTYQWCLAASCLDDDLVNQSDASQVGDKGARLSGGQRARVAFARALYSDASIVLIDDVLSAVDTKVAQRIFHQGILKLKSQGKLVVLVTHHLQWAALSDRVIQMDDGRIVNEAIGSSAISMLLSQYDVDEQRLHDKTDDSLQIENLQTEQSENYKRSLQQGEEETQSPSVIKVYYRYIQELGGYKILFLAMFFYLVDACLNIIITKAFGIWATNSTNQVDYDHSPFLKLMGILISSFLVTSFIKVNFLFNKTLTATSNMHKKLCTSTARSKVAYFDQTPLGSILARFTNDLNNVESMVMLDSHWVLEGCIDNVFVIVIVIVSIQNYIIVIGALVILLFMFHLKTRFTNFMKYSVKCDDISRGLLFNHIEASIQGVTLVRTYGQQERFYQDFLILAYKNMQGYFTFLRLNALIAFIFDCSLNILVILTLQVLILMEVGNRRQIGNADDVGFSILMLLNLGYMFSLNIRGQIYLDIDIENAHRVFKSIDQPSEGQYDDANDYQSQIREWPQRGSIIFQNVSLSYQKTNIGLSKQSSYALKNVSFTVNQGESIGVIGRTGAGKSSLLQAMLRLCELDCGSILIDDIDINSVGLHTLRENLLVIPQNAPIMCVTIKQNIDPKGEYQEDKIWKCLDQVGLTQKIRNLPLQLETIASDSTFSSGEKQLFCMSRVLLRPSPKIILFDEATANMDYETDHHIQETLKNLFPNVTKIIIAHRLQTVVDCDSVMVMELGEIKEFGNPKTLLTDDKFKWFKGMVDALDDNHKKQMYQCLKQ